MTIYDMDNKQIKKYIKSFNETTYGIITFTLSYAISIILLFSVILLTILFTCCFKSCLSCYAPILLVYVCLIILSFILGSVHYYSELIKYIKVKAKKDDNLLDKLIKLKKN